MRKIVFYCSLILLATTSCTKSSPFEMTRYHEDGRAKPMVTIASMIDTTSFDCAWSLSEEFTSMIVHQLSKGAKLFVQANQEFLYSENPFGNDLSWVKREFQNQEFVAFLELVEHENIPAGKGKKESISNSIQDISTNLNMAVRLRVIDLRGTTPKIVLQEMIRDSYYIPKTLLPTDYNQVVWGTQEYAKTPMGIAHHQFVNEIAARLSDYILLAKSR